MHDDKLLYLLAFDKGRNVGICLNERFNLGVRHVDGNVYLCLYFAVYLNGVFKGVLAALCFVEFGPLFVSYSVFVP